MLQAIIHLLEQLRVDVVSRLVFWLMMRCLLVRHVARLSNFRDIQLVMRCVYRMRVNFSWLYLKSLINLPKYREVGHKPLHQFLFLIAFTGIKMWPSTKQNTFSCLKVGYLKSKLISDEVNQGISCHDSFLVLVLVPLKSVLKNLRSKGLTGKIKHLNLFLTSSWTSCNVSRGIEIVVGGLFYCLSECASQHILDSLAFFLL